MYTVSLIRVETYQLEELKSRIEYLLEPLGGMSAIVSKGNRVLLKPNLLTGSRPTKEYNLSLKFMHTKLFSD